ncbi:AAA family ATPase [Candidatus Bathyarchaeota archaeon]|nr:AAA family ATPase [Candidatus Bathyarchaeota archaeon]
MDSTTKEPAKKIPHHVPEPEEPDLAAKELQKGIGNKENLVNELAIEPVGFAMRTAAGDDSNIIVDDPELFEKYCVEQWNAMVVDVGTYLFDQFILPDFAFRVLGVKPGAGKIHSKTKITLVKQRKDLLHGIPRVSLDQVVGQKEAREKARLILKYLEDPDLFGVDWAPRNILFHGPPGTGKTMMARAIAHEAGARFLARTGTTLIGIHVGDGAKKIHQLFEEAFSLRPCIVFIDELDAVGLSRSFQHVRGDVIEVATALLSELDGMQEKTGIVTIACTNQVQLLDPALRSRFEDEIEFRLPELNDRVQLLEAFFKGTKLDVQVNFPRVARKLDGWSGRDIKEKLVKSLIHGAIIAGERVITTGDVLKRILQLHQGTRGKGMDSLVT